MRYESFKNSTGRTPETFHGVHRELVNNAFNQAQKISVRDSVNPREFSDVYPTEDIQKELERVDGLSKKFAQERTPDHELLDKAAFAAEVLVYEQIGLSDWLSAGRMKVYVEKTSELDDVLNKTDIVVTFEDEAGEEEPLALTIDVTIGLKAIGEKIHSIKQEIDARTLARVKYHETPSGERRGLTQTPRVILALEPEELVKLLALWVETLPIAKERLKNHPVQLLFAREIEAQIRAYREYAVRSGDAAFAKKFDRVLTIATEVREEKEKHFGEEETDSSQRMFRMLGTSLRSQLAFVGSQVPEQKQRASREDQERDQIIRGLR